ncbi:AMP-binding protein, partial [Thalassiella azotivora]
RGHMAVRPGPAALAVVLAALRLRVRVALVDPGAGPDVVTARLALAGPTLLVADAAAQAAASWAAPLARRAGLVLPDLGAIAPVVTLGRRLPGCAPRLDDGPTGATRVPDRRGDDGDAVVVFTSGTTAAPRAVVHTVASLSAGMAAVTDLVAPEPGRPVVGGTFFVMAPSLLAGAPVLQPARSPRRVVDQLRRLRPQATYLTPPQLRAVLAAGGRFSGRVLSGSAPVSAALLERVRAAGADEAWGVYALTEAFPVAAVESREKSAFAADGAAGDLVGDLVPGLTARVDGDGQVLVAGPSTADRYLGQEPFAEVATGDVGRVEGRRVVLGGRLKDMVLRGAENIYPGLYEPTLHVPGVEVAVLVGVPADDGDERLVALVQPGAGVPAAQVRASLAGPLSRMGTARPDAVLLADVPLSGRSRKPDRAAASRLAARLLAGGAR